MANTQSTTQCRGITLRGKCCSRPVPIEQKYCWQHKYFRKNDAHWYQHPFVGLTGTVVTVAAFFFAIYAFQYGPSLANQEKGLEDHQEIIQQIEKTQITLREIESPPINIIQKPGIDPNQYGESQKALGKTEHELELTKKEKQELENVVNAYKKEDNEFRKALGLAENIEKTKIIVKILQNYDKGEITKEYALKLSDMVNKASWEDLRYLMENKNIKIQEKNNSLVYAGFFEAKVSPGMRGRERYDQARIEYKLTSEGNKLYEIASSK